MEDEQIDKDIKFGRNERQKCERNKIEGEKDVAEMEDILGWRNPQNYFPTNQGCSKPILIWGVSSFICSNIVYFQKLPEFNLTRIQVM